MTGQPIQWTPTACDTCPEFAKADPRMSYGYCRDKAGPTGSVFSKRWGTMNRFYQTGCPLDPDPPNPRKRPGHWKRRLAQARPEIEQAPRDSKTTATRRKGTGS